MKTVIIKHVDGVKMNRQNPISFKIPSAKEKSEVHVGDYVKIGFIAPDGMTERMWVIVTGENIGELDNTPVFVDMSHKDLVEFKDSEILAIIKAD